MRAIRIPALAALVLFASAAAMAQTSANPSAGDSRSSQAPARISAADRAEIERMDPATRAEVESRMSVGQQTLREVKQTILLNNLQDRYEARSITSVDLSGGSVSFVTRDGGNRTAQFDPRSMQVRD
jgi:hypothetical protein